MKVLKGFVKARHLLSHKLEQLCCWPQIVLCKLYRSSIIKLSRSISRYVTMPISPVAFTFTCWSILNRKSATMPPPTMQPVRAAQQASEKPRLKNTIHKSVIL